MKTLKNILLIGFLTILISPSLNASKSFFIEGGHSNNKPKTLNINTVKKSIVNEFFFEDEEYINDIPFDIYNIIDQYKNEKPVNDSFYFDEEKYIDDIPFCTKCVLDTLTTPSVVWYSDKY